ncbi:MAG: threonine-phosphate decarboxylase CobD [Bacillota bacterium]
MNWPEHGSNPHYLFEALNKEIPDNRVDFSANINPLGPPPLIKENWNSLLSTISDYPDPNGIELKKRIAKTEGLDENQVLIGNGGAEMISLIGRLLTGKRAMIVQPAFSEYEQACRVNGAIVDYHQLTPGSWELDLDSLNKKLRDTDAVFFCNPSNPTGVYYSKPVLMELLFACRENDCLLIIDEAFYDFIYYYESLVEYIKGFPNLLIIRSMTKMFAMPGLRLGYLLADVRVIERIAEFQPQWSMNAIALKAGEWCLESELYRKETINLIIQERKRLFAFYHDLQFNVSPSETNFYLLKDPALDNQIPLFRFLLDNGIIPRHTMNFPGLEGKWLRFAIKSPVENDRLMEAIVEWRNNHSSSL